MSGVRVGDELVEPNGVHPLPDYGVLRAAFRTSTLDPGTVHHGRGPLATVVGRTFGIGWTIAFRAFRDRRKYSAVVAAGEDVGFKLALLAKFSHRHIPIFVTCHNVSSARSSLYLRLLGIGSAVAKFQCMSRAQARILTDRYSVAAGRVQLIYWHVDHEFFRPDHSIPMKNQICSAGMASRDYHTLVQATRGLRVDVKIAADSPWFRQALNISQESLPEGVEVRSYGSYLALRRLYAESLFVVVPLLDVDFSAGYTVILEAMAMGKAVIVSRIKQRDDFVIEGESGFYVTPGSVTELSDRIRFLLDHPDVAREMGARGRCLVEERYTLDHYVRFMQEALGAVPDFTP